MKTIFKTAAISIITFALSATTLPAQSAYSHDSRRTQVAAEGHYQTASWRGDHDRDRGHDRDDHRNWDRDRHEDRGRYYTNGYDNDGYYSQGYYAPVYQQPYVEGGYYNGYARPGRTAALTVGGAAAGAVIGAAAGHGQGAAIGAVIGGVAGLIAGESMHHDRR
ncbi:MAG: glycine zipper domain-containing protein [Acidobacteriota bacterium]|nr:glycine zipper domain-containing protein [Acidobacteriota bacterium]